MDTFRDFAAVPGRYRVDRSMRLLSAYGTERHGSNTPIGTYSLTVSYVDSWAKSHESESKTSFNGGEVEPPNDEIGFAEISEEKFESVLQR